MTSRVWFASSLPEPYPRLTPVTERPLTDDLAELFGHRTFRPGQREVVEAVLRGDDVVAVMPTGGGKSLCYQLPALLLDGLTLVVSPLIALMKDQVDALEAGGHAATFINSSVPTDEQRARIDACRSGACKLLYIAPERLANARFLDALGDMTISRLAVDEAHCISQWGHDFRPDYNRIGELRGLVGSPPTAAFTATATQQVRQDIVRQLGFSEPRVFVAGFERPNLRLVVRRPSGVAEKFEFLDEALDRSGVPAIVYAATRKNVEKIAQHLRVAGRSVSPYHGGLEQMERSRVQDRFMAGESDIIVATNAFGMGVDKQDIRTVVHYDMPGSLDAYYQEAGRAGRDGSPAECMLLYNYADVRIQEFFLEGSNPAPDLLDAVLERLGHSEASAIELETWVSAKNPMALDTALGMLRRRGVLVRGLDPSTGEDLWSLVPPGEDVTPPYDIDWLAAKREADEARLRVVCGFAAGASCRRAYILRYFGSDEARERCDACDRCLNLFRPATRALTDDERRTVRIALSGVARVNDRYGRSRLAQFLVGSKARQVTDAGLDALPTYGLLANLGVRGAGDLLEALADQGLLERRSLDGPGSGAVLSLTEEGRRVMLEDPPIELALPAMGRGKRRRARSSGGGRSRKAPVSDDVDPVLAERLRAWRFERSQELGVPAYQVFTNATMHALAAVRPSSEAELLAVPGIGPSRLERYGAGILAVLNEQEGNTP